ncbi:MAG: hypothetical protein GXZ11_02890 [Tissierellia bacterium]|nr:hypothetical protein [Tissierellia bacterium]
MEFHQALKELIKLTDVMVKDVSACVQYDQSYISKWLSGTKLPTDKSVNYVINQLSHFFSIIIVDDHLEDDLRELVAVPINLDHAGDVEAVVKAMLEDGYYRSASMVEGEGELVSGHRVVVGRNAAIQFSLDTIKRHLSNHNDKEEIICTLDLFNILPEINLETFNVIMTRPLQLSVSTVLDLDVQESGNMNKVRSLLAFLNQTINVDFFIYEDNHAMRNNVIIMKNHFVFWYYLDEDGKVSACQYIDDPDFVEMAYYDSWGMFDHNKIVLKSTSGQKLRNIEYDLDFIASPPYMLMGSVVLGLFLTPIMLEKRKELYSEKKYESAAFFNNLLTQHICSQSLTVFTSRSYLMNFIKTGRVYYLGEVFYLDEAERGIYIRNIIRTLQTNPNFRLFIIQDDLSPFYTSKISMSIAFTENKALIIKTPEALYNKRFPYYMVTSQRLVNIINNYAQVQLASEPVRKMTREDTEALLLHYLTMFRL